MFFCLQIDSIKNNRLQIVTFDVCLVSDCKWKYTIYLQIVSA